MRCSAVLSTSVDQRMQRCGTQTEAHALCVCQRQGAGTPQHQPRPVLRRPLPRSELLMPLSA
jgi:hypothetical protein